MYLNGIVTKLRIGDVAIFRANDGIVQFMRGSQKLLNKTFDDKTIISNIVPLTEDYCSNIANIIAITHGFDTQDMAGSYRKRGLYYFRFVGIKKEKTKESTSTSEIRYRIKVRKS
jgi:hypothetical protein